MNTVDSNVTDMNIPHIIECFSWFSVTFIEERFCLFRTWSFTLFKNDLDSHWQFWFCFVVSNDKLLWPCSSLRDHNGLPRSITRCCLVHNGLRCSILLGLLMKETWLGLVCFSPRGHSGLPRSILSLSFRTPRILISIASLPRAFWRRGWQIRGSPCNKTHHWSRFRCDSLFSWILLWSFMPSLQNKL